MNSARPCPALPGPSFASPSRIRLLVSVRDAGEASEALAGGADWIDLKEPLGGALGAVDAATAQRTAELVDGRAPVSAAAGELVDWPHGAARDLLEAPGVSHLKLGLAGCRRLDWQRAWRAAHAEVAAAGKQLVAVAYADYQGARAPHPAAVLSLAAAASGAWALVDTHDKRRASLDEQFDRGALRELFAPIRASGKRMAAAGKLTERSLGALPMELIDMVGVRGAACRAGRRSEICRRRVRSLRIALDALEANQRPRSLAPILERSQPAFFET